MRSKKNKKAYYALCILLRESDDYFQDTHLKTHVVFIKANTYFQYLPHFSNWKI